MESQERELSRAHPAHRRVDQAQESADLGLDGGLRARMADRLGRVSGAAVATEGEGACSSARGAVAKVVVGGLSGRPDA